MAKKYIYGDKSFLSDKLNIQSSVKAPYPVEEDEEEKKSFFFFYFSGSKKKTSLIMLLILVLSCHVILMHHMTGIVIIHVSNWTKTNPFLSLPEGSLATYMYLSGG